MFSSCTKYKIFIIYKKFQLTPWMNLCQPLSKLLCHFNHLGISRYTRYPSINLFIYLSIYLIIYPYIYLSIHLSIYPFIYQYTYLSIYLSICTSIYLSIHLSIYPSMYTSVNSIYL